jgi:hypothetical protein
VKILLVLILIVSLKKSDGEDEQDDEAEDELKKKIANPLRRAEPIRVMRLAFMVSFATSQGGFKGTKLSICGGGLAVFAPGGAVLDDPVRQRLLKADVTTGFFRLNPFVT